jgi:glycosyltransferase involved in cell wall biosynthesis
MKGKDKGVIMVATSRRTRGGVTAVVEAYMQADALRDYSPFWLETHIDRNPLLKTVYFLFALVRYGLFLPSNRIVHLHISTPVSAFRKLFFLIPAKLSGKKVISHVHCSIPATHIESSPFFRLLYLLFFRSSQHIFVLSEAWKKQIASMGKTKASVEVLYNPACSVPPRQFAKEQQYVLFMGTISRPKGCFDLLQAFQRIADVFPDWQLVFSGTGDLTGGRRLSEELGITEKVEFRGWTEAEEKQKLFSEAAIVCLPSYSEGFPMTVVEAWSYSLPVVCTPAGGLSDVVRDGETALLVKAGDVNNLAKQLGRLMADADLRKQIGDAAHDLAINTFGLPYISGRLAAVYERLLRE